jgi:predicted kinase
LEAEAHELEREFAAARAAAMSAPVEEISFAAPPKTVRRSLT